MSNVPFIKINKNQKLSGVSCHNNMAFPPPTTAVDTLEFGEAEIDSISDDEPDISTDIPCTVSAVHSKYFKNSNAASTHQALDRLSQTNKKNLSTISIHCSTVLKKKIIKNSHIIRPTTIHQGSRKSNTSPLKQFVYHIK